MSDLYAEDAFALRQEIASLRARLELHADALASALEEIKRLEAELDECRKDYQ